MRKKTKNLSPEKEDRPVVLIVMGVIIVAIFAFLLIYKYACAPGYWLNTQYEPVCCIGPQDEVERIELMDGRVIIPSDIDEFTVEFAVFYSSLETTQTTHYIASDLDLEEVQVMELIEGDTSPDGFTLRKREISFEEEGVTRKGVGVFLVKGRTEYYLTREGTSLDTVRLLGWVPAR
jgi:hypothetical protein